MPRLRPADWLLLSVLGCVILALGWAYWQTIVELDRRWSTDPLYSHGYFIPVIAAALLYRRRDLIRIEELRPSAWGIPFLLLAMAMRLIGDYYYYSATDRFSLMPALAGICLLLGGWPALRWAWPAIAYLLFMLPLPGRLPELLGNPLQRLATLSSTAALQILGFPAQAEGNVLVLPHVDLEVVEACSGIRMLVVFCALATAVAVFVQRSLVQRIVIVASAIPLALLCNFTRIVLTGVLYETAGGRAADMLFHDAAGFFMALLGSGLLWLELALLSCLFVPIPSGDPLTAGLLAGRSRPA